MKRGITMSELINYINNVEVIGGLKYVLKNKQLNIEELSSLASLENLNYQDEDGYTALHHYLRWNVNLMNIDILKLLITKENVDLEDKDKSTPIHIYISYAHRFDFKIVTLLATSNNVNKQFTTHKTLVEFFLYYRYQNYDINIIRYLIDIGGIIYDETLPEYYYYKCKCLQRENDELRKIKSMSCILENSMKKYF